MTQLSVKGLTVCTPEFHQIAKRGEREYLDNKLVEFEHETGIYLSESDIEYMTEELGLFGKE